MQQIQILANVRTEMKKNAMNRLRKQDMIPAVLYGKGQQAFNLQVAEKELYRAIHTSAGTNVLVKLNIAGEDKPREETVMIKLLQRHPVTSKVLHVDFVTISLDKPLETSIPVVLTGTAPGIKEGGILEQVHRDLAIRCLPTMIPENITLDISGLAIGDAITVADLKIADGIDILVEAHEPVVHITAPRIEEAPVAEEAEAVAVTAEEPQQPEVIGEKEREQRRAEKENK